MPNKLIIKESVQLVKRTKSYNRFKESYLLTKLYLTMRFNIGDMSLDDVVEIRHVIQDIRIANARKWAETFFEKSVKPRLLKAAFKNKDVVVISVCKKNQKNIMRWHQLLQYCTEQGYNTTPFEKGYDFGIWSPIFFQLMIELPDGQAS